MNKHRATGVTIVELLVAIAVLGVLLGIAVPGFGEISKANKVTSAANELTTALNFARSEATKRHHPVSVCPSNEGGTACVDASDWSPGWIAFTDNGVTLGAVDLSETVLQAWNAAAAVEIEQTSTINYVSFDFDGSPTGLVEATFEISAADSHKYPRCLRVSRTGRISIAKQACA